MRNIGERDARAKVEHATRYLFRGRSWDEAKPSTSSSRGLDETKEHQEHLQGEEGGVPWDYVIAVQRDKQDGQCHSGATKAVIGKAPRILALGGFG